MGNIFGRLRELITPYNNSEWVTYLLCRSLKTKVTKSYVQQQLEEHPDYPSLLAISDVLANTGIDNAAIRTSTDKFDDYQFPLITQVSLVNNGIRENHFTLVTKNEHGLLFFYPSIG